MTWEGGGRHKGFVRIGVGAGIGKGDGEGSKWEFYLVSEGRKILFACKTSEERDVWVTTLEDFQAT